MSENSITGANYIFNKFASVFSDASNLALLPEQNEFNDMCNLWATSLKDDSSKNTENKGVKKPEAFAKNAGIQLGWFKKTDEKDNSSYRLLDEYKEAYKALELAVTEIANQNDDGELSYEELCSNLYSDEISEEEVQDSKIKNFKEVSTQCEFKGNAHSQIKDQNTDDPYLIGHWPSADGSLAYFSTPALIIQYAYGITKEQNPEDFENLYNMLKELNAQYGVNFDGENVCNFGGQKIHLISQDDYIKAKENKNNDKVTTDTVTTDTTTDTTQADETKDDSADETNTYETINAEIYEQNGKIQEWKEVSTGCALKGRAYSSMNGCRKDAEGEYLTGQWPGAGAIFSTPALIIKFIYGIEDENSDDFKNLYDMLNQANGGIFDSPNSANIGGKRINLVTPEDYEIAKNQTIEIPKKIAARLEQAKAEYEELINEVGTHGSSANITDEALNEAKAKFRAAAQTDLEARLRGKDFDFPDSANYQEGERCKAEYGDGTYAEYVLENGEWQLDPVSYKPGTLDMKDVKCKFVSKETDKEYINYRNFADGTSSYVYDKQDGEVSSEPTRITRYNSKGEIDCETIIEKNGDNKISTEMDYRTGTKTVGEYQGKVLIQESYDYNTDGVYDEVRVKKEVGGYESRILNVDTSVDYNRQGNVGDCWLLATLKALSVSELGQKYLDESFSDNGDGTYTIDFKGVGKKITISNERLSQERQLGNYSSYDATGLLYEVAVNELMEDMQQNPKDYNLDYIEYKISQNLGRIIKNSAYQGDENGILLDGSQLAFFTYILFGKGQQSIWMNSNPSRVFSLDKEKAAMAIYFTSSNATSIKDVDGNDFSLITAHYFTIVDTDMENNTITLVNPWCNNVKQTVNVNELYRHAQVCLDYCNL